MAAEAVGTSIVSGVASTVADSASNCIGQEVSYVFKYRTYIDELKNQVEQLRYERQRVESAVGTARGQGDEIFEPVEQWMVRVDKFTEEMVKPIMEDEEKAKKRSFMGLCPNLTTRYALSKKAVKAARDCAILLANGNTISDVSRRPVLQRTESVYVRGYEAFDSRIPVLEKIMQALADSNVNRIGVYGMGGVGKTTLVKKVAAKAREDNLFDVVVMAEVTQTPDLKKIQGQIADPLGLVFQEESEEGRANRLRDRMKKEKGRVLIILDNIWEKIDLDAVGIPIGYDEKGSSLQKEDLREINEDQSSEQRVQWCKTDDSKRFCKILLTSRNVDVLRNQMDTQKFFPVHPLIKNEAKDLFEKIVGNKPEMSDYQSIVDDIVEKCGGLPLAIATIANALKNKTSYYWRASLDKLKGSNPRSIPGMTETLYTTIELSYHSLKSEEAKFLFLLCGLFGTGSAISVNLLLVYGMGLGLFDDVDTLVKGRNKLHMLIDILKASCLLLDGYNNHVVRMHDVIHVVATSIASTEKLMFNIQNVTGLKERLEGKELKPSTAISLFFRDIHADELPERLTFPKLELFHLIMKENCFKIPDCFLDGTKELKVLHLCRICFPSLASSLRYLIKLRSLSLVDCMLGDIAIIGELKELEILILQGSDIKKLPKEIGELNRLKLLNLINCSALKVIAPNVLSRLSQLEELYMGYTFIQWEVSAADNQESSNASIVELKQLSHLTTLDIHVLDAQIMPYCTFYEKLERYNIFIGDVWNWHGKFETSRQLKLKISNRCRLGYGIKILLDRAEDLYLDELNGVNNVLYELDTKGFSQLKHLHVQNGSQLLYVVHSGEQVPNDAAFPMLESLSLRDLINLENICCGQLNEQCFSKLRSIKIENCDKLKCLFSVSMSRNLSQLQELEVCYCKNLEEIFAKESSDQNLNQNERNGEVIEFSRLHSLTMKCLPKLKSFGFDKKKPLISQTSFATSPGCKEIVEENETEDFMALFSQKVVLPRLENLKLSCINLGNIWLDQFSEMSSFCQSLTNLTVEECNYLKFLFPYSMIKSLAKLRNLVVWNCKSMERVIDVEGVRGQRNISMMSFPQLFYMELKGLPNLTTFGLGDLVEFPLLKTLQIDSCTNLKTFFSSSSCVQIVSNEHQEMDNTENCPVDLYHLFDEKAAFPSLEKMMLKQLDKMQLIWHNQLHEHSFCKLKEVRVELCEKMTTVIPSHTQGLLNFQNLEKLVAFSCRSMKSLFPDSIATGLLQLKHIDVRCCGLEEIVAMEEGEGDLRCVFPELNFFQLGGLPELKCLYKGSYTTKWPKLRSLHVADCPMIQLFGKQFLKTDAESESEISIQDPLLMLEKVAPDLEGFSFNSDDVKSICLSQFSTEIFCKLKYLTLTSFTDEYVVFPFDFLKKFQCLESLFIRGNNFKELFQYELGVDDEEKHCVGFMTIKSLSLLELPHLEHIWGKDCQVHTLLPKLISLRVNRCHRLICLMPSSAPLNNLAYLEVSFCNRLAKILSCSTANSLVQLTTLKISNCNLVTEVLAYEANIKEEEEVVLRKLRFLELRCLSSLTCFCLANCTLKFPCLDEVIVVQCPNLEIFSVGILDTPRLKVVKRLKQNNEESIWTNDLNSTIQQVCFGNIKRVQVSKFPQLKGKWNDQIPVHSFSNLRSLVVDEFSDLSTAIPHNLLQYLNNLESLEVRSCDSVKEVFDLERQLNADGQIWKKSYRQILCFHNLKSLKVDNCNSLRYMFTSVVILSLVQLEKIEIRNCAAIEEIIRDRREEEEDAAHAKTEAPVFEEEGINMAQLFPKLQHLMLIDLPKVIRFCNFTGNIIELPSLIKLSVENCPDIKSFISGHSTCATESKEIEEMKLENCCVDIHSFFDEKVAFPRLENIILSRLDKLQMIWHHQLHEDSFCKLQTLRVKHCEKILTIVPSNTLGRLSRLTTLRISDCASLGEVLEFQGLDIVEEETMSKMLLSKLEKLKLKGLPRLARFCNINGNFIELSSLSELCIENCPCMKTFINKFSRSDNTSDKEPEEMNSKENLHIEIQPLFDKKVRFPSLELLAIWHMDELRKIWDDQLSSDSFCKLRGLGVAYCNKLLNIIPSNMLGLIQKLEILGVEGCDSVEEIFEVIEKSSYIMEETVDNEEAVSRFLFPKLTELCLSMLPSVKILYPGTLISEWPMLKKLTLNACNKVEIFASEFLCFQENQGKSQHEIPIPQPFFLVDKGAFPSLEELRLTGDDSYMKEIWQGGKFSEQLCGIKVLKLKKFLKKDAIIPSCFLYTLPNLEKLVVSDASFREIFLCEGFCCDGKHPEAFGKLRDLKLSKLPELLYLWKEESQPCRAFQNLACLLVSECGKLEYLVPSLVSLQNLTILEVSKCDGLVNLMTTSAAQSLVHLAKLKITDCKIIEEIIIRVGDEVENQLIPFIELKHLVLQGLPSLTSFCSGSVALAFPSLEQVIVSQCFKMKIFSQGELRTPKLRRLQPTEGNIEEGHWQGDLNTTIQHLYKEMDVQSSKEDRGQSSCLVKLE